MSWIIRTGVFFLFVNITGFAIEFEQQIEQVPIQKVQIPQQHSADWIDPGAGGVVLDQIINLGDSIWRIVERSEPTFQVSYPYANALPEGVRSAQDLEAFSEPQLSGFRLFAKNKFGVEVYNVVMNISHQYKGQYRGKGRYLDGVTIFPQKVRVRWGYTVDMMVKVVTVTNVGTHAEPVSSLTLELSTRLKTPVNLVENRSLFQFRGDAPEAKTLNATTKVLETYSN